MRRIYVELPEHPTVRFIAFSKHPGILFENLSAEPYPAGTVAQYPYLIREELPPEFFETLAQQSSVLLAKYSKTS